MNLEQRHSYWVDRFRAVGRVQSRTLWAILLSCLFFGALAATLVQQGAARQSVTVPLIDLQLDASAVLAAGPVVIASLLLILTGTFRALKAAMRELGIRPEKERAGSVEMYDTYPTGLELALYTSHEAKPWLQALLSLAYPVLVSLSFVEIFWLAWTAVRLRGWTPFVVTTQGLAILFGGVALYQMAGMTRDRWRQIRETRHTKAPPARERPPSAYFIGGDR